MLWRPIIDNVRELPDLTLETQSVFLTLIR